MWETAARVIAQMGLFNFVSMHVRRCVCAVRAAGAYAGLTVAQQRAAVQASLRQRHGHAAERWTAAASQRGGSSAGACISTRGDRGAERHHGQKIYIATDETKADYFAPFQRGHQAGNRRRRTSTVYGLLTGVRAGG